MTLETNCKYRWASVLILVIVSAINGCQQHKESKTESKVPKLRFHCPKTYPAAVKRIREIHEILISQKQLPEPTSYEVVEFTHGEGAAAHSHYLLASEFKDNADPDHSHDSDSIRDLKRHMVKVDIFTELNDIVRWIPDVAADSDMSKQSWNTVNRTSEELGKILDPIISEDASPAEMRTSYREHAKSSDQLIREFESTGIKSQTND